MKPVLIAAAAALALSACASGGYYGGDLGYNAYYDDAYGPYNDGYWGRDGAFWYSSRPHGPYLRDGGNHFRRGAFDGGHGVRGRGGFFHHH